MRSKEPPRLPRSCANCGAHNPLGATTCGVCGQPLITEELSRLWNADGSARPSAETEVIDLYPSMDMSSQATTPFTQTRPFDPLDARSSAPPRVTRAERTDPWSSAGGRLSGSERTIRSGTAGARIEPREQTATKRAGPPGFVLGCLATILIAALAGVVIWSGIRSTISNRVEDEISVGISNELRRIDTLPVTQSGRLLITEEEINTDLEQSSRSYEPLEDVVVHLERGVVRVEFKLYGLKSTYKSGLAIESGKVVAVNPTLSGAAGRFVEIDDITAMFEAETGELLRRSGVEPVGITISDGSILLETKRAAPSATQVGDDT
jgi:hypothetical protein